MNTLLQRSCVPVVCAIVFAFTVGGVRSDTLMLFQESDSSKPRLLTESERAQLGDPFFNLVLKDHAGVTNVEDIFDLIQPLTNKRAIFVVDERITVSDVGKSRRTVAAFRGEHQGEELAGNVMLSIIAGKDRYPRETTVIEAWGWDNHRERYNYYKLDRTGTVDNTLTWKFRDSSDNADLLAPNERRGSCVRCHVNGAPVMKELFRPWNNWHSGDFNARYLSEEFSPTPVWLLSDDPLFKTNLEQAQRLEPTIIDAIHRFNRARINSTLKREDNTRNIETEDGFQTVLEGRRLLRPLFRMSEFNLISARQGSGLGPFSTHQGPQNQIVIPASFFLNIGLISGGGSANYHGLGISEARQFLKIGELAPGEYKTLIDESKIAMRGQVGRDAHFAWFVPEPSHIDSSLIDQLLRRGIITSHFLAAALVLDLEEPVFLSQERESLLQLIPERFRFKPVAETNDPNATPRNVQDDILTKSVVTAIEAIPEAGRSARAKEFLRLLKLSDARAELRSGVITYAERLKRGLKGETRKSELKRLFEKAIRTRRGVLADDVMGHLDETNGKLLLPLPLP